MKIELVENVEIKVGEVVDVIEPIGCIGCAETRMLGDDHVIGVGERAHEGQPGSSPAGTVQDHERLAGAAAHQPDVATADRHHRSRLVRHSTSPRLTPKPPPSSRGLKPRAAGGMVHCPPVANEANT